MLLRIQISIHHIYASISADVKKETFSDKKGEVDIVNNMWENCIW